jgi:hypothetical protein
MPKTFLIILFFLIPFFSFSKKLKKGNYTFQIAYEEWFGKNMGEKCIVKIKTDSIFVFENTPSQTLIDKGLLIQHQSGRWIIAKQPSDKFTNEIGSCADGPMIIDVKKRIVYFC